LERDTRRRGAFSLYWDSNALALPTAPFRLTQQLESLKVSINLDVASKKRTLHFEAFEKCSILFKAKEGENFNHTNTLSILRIKI
jgi:hypothetical protein